MFSFLYGRIFSSATKIGTEYDRARCVYAIYSVYFTNLMAATKALFLQLINDVYGFR
jgi:hypothetical protein